MAGLIGASNRAANERPRAPGALALLQAFVNSVDIEAGADSISTPAELETWLREHGLGHAGAMSPDDLEQALDLREALRAALESNAHPPAPTSAGAPNRLDQAAAATPLRVVATPSGPRLAAPGSGVAAAMGALLAIAVEASADGSWARLKICRNDACRWAYWDASRNRSGTWCSMAICGNRAKGRTFRQRRASPEGSNA